MIAFNLFLYALSFLLIWFGSGMIISAADKFSHKLRASSFAVSFLLLGILTSTPEFAVGMRAVAAGEPEVFVGNLLGGVAIIFLLIIPMLAIFGHGIELLHRLNKRELLWSMLVIASPAVLVLDKRVTELGGIILISMYFVLLYQIQKNKGLVDGAHTEAFHAKSYSLIDILKVLLGVGLVFISSEIIVSRTIFFADTLRISHFFISLVMLSLGTNLPEMTLAIRAIMNKKKSVAFGDYLGSAAANTLLFGVFTFLSRNGIWVQSNFWVSFIFIIAGLGLFYIFALSKLNLSVREGKILLGVYAAFIVAELFVG